MGELQERNQIDILTVKDIQRDYPGLSRDNIYEILNRKGCPLITGKKYGETKRIARGAFEKFIGLVF